VLGSIGFYPADVLGESDDRERISESPVEENESYCRNEMNLFRNRYLTWSAGSHSFSFS
jgi:hypothetical protein